MDQEKNIADHEMMEMERKTKKMRKKVISQIMRC